MSRVMLRKNNSIKRKLRVRKKVFGTAERPRLAVIRSNRYVTAQIIDDVKGITLVSTGAEVKKAHAKKTKTEAAFDVGKELAKKAIEHKISKVVFDRNGYKYHGRVKSFAEGAREGGLQF